MVAAGLQGSSVRPGWLQLPRLQNGGAMGKVYGEGTKWRTERGGEHQDQGKRRKRWSQVGTPPKGLLPMERTLMGILKSTQRYFVYYRHN